MTLDVPKLKTVQLPDAFEDVQLSQISSRPLFQSCESRHAFASRVDLKLAVERLLNLGPLIHRVCCILQAIPKSPACFSSFFLSFF